MSRPARYPAILSLVTSVIVAVSTLGIWGFAPDTLPRTHITLIGIAAMSAVISVFIGRAIKLGTAWLVLAAIATPSLVLVPIYQPPIWFFPLIVLVLAGFYINGVRERVPLYLSNPRTQTAVSDIVQEHGAESFVDLGCGLGDVVCSVARKSSANKVLGVETAPFSYLIALGRAIVVTGGRASVRFQNIWSTDVSNADVVYAFLSPAPMARLFKKLKTEMKPGSIFVSNSFAVPGSEPDEIVSVDDTRGTQLLIWRM